MAQGLIDRLSPYLKAKLPMNAKHRVDILNSKWAVEVKGKLYGPISFEDLERYETIGKMIQIRPMNKRIIDLMRAAYWSKLEHTT